MKEIIGKVLKKGGGGVREGKLFIIPFLLVQRYSYSFTGNINFYE